MLALAMNLRPAGSAPVSLSVALGYALTAMPAEALDPAVKVELAAEVNTGASVTFSVKPWKELGLTPLLALKVIRNCPPLDAGAMVSVPVPSPLSMKDAKAGSEPAVRAGVGKPLVVTVNVPPVL